MDAARASVHKDTPSYSLDGGGIGIGCASVTD